MSAAYDWDPLLTHDEPPQQFAGPLPETKGSKRSRQTYSKYQTAVLETVFQTSKYIVRSRRQQMSAELNLTERQIKIWFQNRRMKEKKCGVHCKESPPPPPADDCGTAALAVGYADDYAELGRTAGYRVTAPGPEDAFADFCALGPAARHRPPPPQHHESAGGYAGYGHCDGAGGYDPAPQVRHHEADPYAAAAKQHLHWGASDPVCAVMDYDQDFFADHDLDHFQRLPTGHHHHHHHHHHRPLMNSQVPDYCPPQLQATHGY